MKRKYIYKLYNYNEEDNKLEDLGRVGVSGAFNTKYSKSFWNQMLSIIFTSYLKHLNIYPSNF